MMTMPKRVSPHQRPVSTEWAMRVHKAREILRDPDLNTRDDKDEMINLAYGNSVRRPHASVVVESVKSLFDTNRYSLEDYKTLEDDPALLQTIQRFFKRFEVSDATNGNILIEAGTTSLLANFCHTYFDDGGALLCPRGYYHELPAWCEQFALEFCLLDTRASEDFKVTPEVLGACLSSATPDLRDLPKALVIANPSVTGAVYSSAELEALADLALQHDIFMVYDIVYADTVFPGVTMPGFPRRAAHAENAIVVSSVSKSNGLANVRVGWGCGPERVIRRMTLYRELTMGTVPFPNQIMAEAALRAPLSYIKNSAAECLGRYQMVERLIAELNMEIRRDFGGLFDRLIRIVHVPQAAHSVMLSIPALKNLKSPLGGRFETSLDLAAYLIAEGRVIISPAYSMGFDDLEFRLCFGPIGHAQTHPMSVSVEQNALLSMLKDPAFRIPDDTVPEQGFSQGRSLLEVAFRDRLLPALRKVLEHNMATLEEIEIAE